MRILTNLKGGPLVKLVKGEGRATRVRALARRAVTTVFVIHVGHSYQS
jgi:hypothetical protein